MILGYDTMKRLKIKINTDTNKISIFEKETANLFRSIPVIQF